jgi:hypothetical protein
MKIRTGTGAPRWVRASAAVALVVVVLLVVLLLARGDEHGPSRHTGGLGGTHDHAAQRS